MNRPGWERLWRHSYGLGLRWLARNALRGWPGRRTGLVRLLVPLDPWRYYELGRLADERYSGRCLDVSSPKLLPSLLQKEGQGRWTCIDLFETEIEGWRRVDPQLELSVANACALPFGDASFDHCLCVSVLEHIDRGADATALAEMWRVLVPGGVLRLTTDVSHSPSDVYLDERIYGEASKDGEHGVFFKHEYGVGEIDELVGALAWQVVTREFAAQRDPSIESRFYGRVPWSYLYGALLRLKCPSNFEISASPDLIERVGRGVVYLELRKPAS